MDTLQRTGQLRSVGIRFAPRAPFARFQRRASRGKNLTPKTQQTANVCKCCMWSRVASGKKPYLVSIENLHASNANRKVRSYSYRDLQQSITRPLLIDGARNNSPFCLTLKVFYSSLTSQQNPMVFDFQVDRQTENKKTKEKIVSFRPFPPHQLLFFFRETLSVHYILRCSC